MTVCAAGGTPIVGTVRFVALPDGAGQVAMCETHADVHELGLRLIKRHGVDHRVVTAFVDSCLFSFVDEEPCPGPTVEAEPAPTVDLGPVPPLETFPLMQPPGLEG